MKKAMSVFALAAMLLATLSLAVYAADQAKSTSQTGWISDSSCAVKGMSADHKACAKKCVNENGATWVFVNSKTKAVQNIHNQDAVVADTALGQEVVVAGHAMPDGSLHVDSITPVKSK